MLIVGVGGRREIRLIEAVWGKAGVEARSGEAGRGLSIVSRLARTTGDDIMGGKLEGRAGAGAEPFQRWPRSSATSGF